MQIASGLDKVTVSPSISIQAHAIQLCVCVCVFVCVKANREHNSACLLENIYQSAHFIT